MTENEWVERRLESFMGELETLAKLAKDGELTDEKVTELTGDESPDGIWIKRYIASRYAADIDDGRVSVSQN